VGKEVKDSQETPSRTSSSTPSTNFSATSNCFSTTRACQVFPTAAASWDERFLTTSGVSVSGIRPWDRKTREWRWMKERMVGTEEVEEV